MNNDRRRTEFTLPRPQPFGPIEAYLTSNSSTCVHHLVALKLEIEALRYSRVFRQPKEEDDPT